MIDKSVESASAAVEPIPDGASLAIGGFGQVGVPVDLIDALCDKGVTGLHIMANNGGRGLSGERGIGRMLAEDRVRRFTCSFPINPEFFRRYFAGSVEIELLPQGTLAERLRAGGAGIGGFFTATGAGTQLGDGGFVMRYDAHGQPADVMAAKEQRVIDGRSYVLEQPLRPDFALVRAHAGDRYGNLRFRLGARNFNPIAAMAARHTIAQLDVFDPSTVIAPDDVHLPGVFVDVVVPTSAATLAARAAGATTGAGAANAAAGASNEASVPASPARAAETGGTR